MPDPRTEASFAVCVANDGCDDLTVGVLYRVLPDEAEIPRLLAASSANFA